MTVFVCRNRERAGTEVQEEVSETLDVNLVPQRMVTVGRSGMQHCDDNDAPE